MKLTTILTALALSTAALSAQSFTSPKGLDNIEGNAAFAHWAGAAGRRLQGVDDTQRGAPRVIRQLAFRRDQNGGSGARTMDIKLTMAECNMMLLDAAFDANLQVNSVVVLQQTGINMPDWSAKPAPPPAPFDYVLPFSQPWVYQSRGALVWDIEYVNSSSGSSSSTDRDYTFYTSSTGSAVGTGCGSHVHKMDMRSNGPVLPNWGMHINFNGTGGPANAPVFLMIDAVDSNLTIPGLCATLHAFPTFLVPCGLTTATGETTYKTFSFPYIAGLAGATFYTQLLALDVTQPGLPFSLSNAVKATMPSVSTATGHEACYMWASLPSTVAVSGLIFFGGSLVVELR